MDAEAKRLEKQKFCAKNHCHPGRAHYITTGGDSVGLWAYSAGDTPNEDYKLV
jgi:hypothetical protein